MRPLILVLLAACSPRVAPPAAPAEAAVPAPSMVFEEISLPPGADAAREPIVSARAIVDRAPVALSYTVLRRRGDDDFGRLHDRQMAPIPGDEGLCNEQDFNSTIQVDGQAFLVSHFECTPGAMTISALDQSADGTLSVRSSRPVDFSAVGGLWNPCAGVRTPWNTHLGSEEYEPDARAEPTPDQYWPNYAWQHMKRYQAEPLDPYRYGWIPEVRISAEGVGSPVKHLSPGRASHEIAYVLPDQRTVYLSDDGTKVGWFLFIADRAGDLSSGSLYAAKLAGLPDGAMTVGWVPMGHSADADLAPLLAQGLRFSDLFDAASPQDGTCPDGFRLVDHHYGEECLRLAAPSERVPNPAMAASRFEKRRYAAYLGATTELEKAEGVTFDPATGRLFLAMARVGKAMSDGRGHLDVPANPCGVVYAGELLPDQRDTTGAPMPTAFTQVRLAPFVAGTPLDDGKRCDPGGIAGPDNITYLPGYDQLVVAEDTSLHEQAFLWAFDRQGVGRRLMVAPPFGEFTGVHWVNDLGGFGYLNVTVQHPWSEGDVVMPEGIGADDQRTFTGVLGPFPALRGATMQAE
jgi:secreted PhoX family phosphatase